MVGPVDSQSVVYKVIWPSFSSSVIRARLATKQLDSSSAEIPSASSPSPGLQKQPVRNEIIAALARVSTSPDAFLLDEALRFLYARSDGELRDVMRVDLQKLAADLRERVNARLETPIVKDIVVNELTYLTKDQVKRQ